YGPACGLGCARPLCADAAGSTTRRNADRAARRTRRVQGRVVTGRVAAGKPCPVMAPAPTGRVESIRAVRRGFRRRTSKSWKFESGLRLRAPEISACLRCGTEQTRAQLQAS